MSIQELSPLPPYNNLDNLTNEQIVAVVQAFLEAKKRKPLDFQRQTFYSSLDFWYYLAIEDPVTCWTCDVLKNQVFNGTELRLMFPWHLIISSDQIIPQVHPHCLLEGTKVTTNRGLMPIEKVKTGDLVLTHKGRYRPVIELHRNKYRGRIHCVNGSWLTENHPMLTPNGWVCTENLQDGDCVISVNSGNGLFPALAESDYMPSLLSEQSLFSFILKSFPFVLMPFAPVNFNCYFRFWKSKVNVKDVNGVLWNNLDVVNHQNPEEFLFWITKLGVLLYAKSTFNKIFVRPLRASHFGVACLSLVRSLFRRHFSPSQGLSFALSSFRDSCFGQYARNWSPRHAKSFGYGFHAKSFGKIESDNFRNRHVYPLHTITLLKNTRNRLFKGTVYNLSVGEDESYCIGVQRLAVHNCRCTLLRVTDINDYLSITSPPSAWFHYTQDLEALQICR